MSENLVDLVYADDPSLRLPLGRIALKTIGMKVESIQADLAANRHIAEQAVFES